MLLCALNKDLILNLFPFIGWCYFVKSINLYLKYMAGLINQKIHYSCTIDHLHIT